MFAISITRNCTSVINLINLPIEFINTSFCKDKHVALMGFLRGSVDLILFMCLLEHYCYKVRRIINRLREVYLFYVFSFFMRIMYNR